MSRIDFKAIPEVEEMIARCVEMRASDDERTRRAGTGYFRIDEGVEVHLAVVITDTDLFQMVAESIVSDKTILSIPGAKIQEIGLLKRKNDDVLIGWLREQIHNIEEGKK